MEKQIPTNKEKNIINYFDMHEISKFSPQKIEMTGGGGGERGSEREGRGEEMNGRGEEGKGMWRGWEKGKGRGDGEGGRGGRRGGGWRVGSGHSPHPALLMP